MLRRTQSVLLGLVTARLQKRDERKQRARLHRALAPSLVAHLPFVGDAKSSARHDTMAILMRLFILALLVAVASAATGQVTTCSG